MNTSVNAAPNGPGEETGEETGEESGEEAGVRGEGRRTGGKEERGSGTVLMLGTGVLLLVLFGAVLLLLQSAVAANRAATAADLAALAAADTVRGLREGDACAVAGEVADRNAAALTGCAVNAGDHTVEVNTEVTAGLVPWPATGRARAGPPP